MKKATSYSWLMLILILFFAGKIFAQLPEREMLPLEIAKETNDTTRIKLIIRYVMRWAPLPEFKKWYDEIQALSLKNNYKPGLIYARFYEGYMLSSEGKYDEAIEEIKSCIDGLDSLGVVQFWQYPIYQIRFMYFSAGKQLEMFRYYTDKIAFYKRHGPIENTAACYHNIGKYYLSIADYDRAIGYFMRALDVYNTFDPWGVMNERGSIGSTYFKWGNLDKAEESLRSFLTGMEKLSDVYNSNAYDALGDLYFEKKDFKQALNYFFKGKDHYIQPHFQASNLVSIANVYLQLGFNDSALIYLEKAEEIRQREKSVIYFASNFDGLDFYYYKYYAATGDKKQALRYLETVLNDAQTARNVELILKYTNELQLYLLKQGDSLQALRYLVQYQAIRDSLNTLNTRARIASFEIEQESQLKENEIEQLQTQKTTQRNYYLIAGAFLLLIVMAVISRLRYKRKRDEEQLKTEFKKQFAQAETKALRAQMNPHFIFNCLNSINSYVIDQKHETASDYLIKFSKLIRLILDNSRSETISIEKELETLKLYVLLESARFENKFACVFTIAEDVNTSTIMIPPMLLQPFVENAIWHGLMQKEDQGTIIIDIKKADEEFLNISIIDDGIGREKAAELKSKSATYISHGLKVTSQRIDMMNKLNSSGAQVHIFDLKDEQGVATGTKVELIIPF
jgi:tetratricopeptide (TPR) repeat protein